MADNMNKVIFEMQPPKINKTIGDTSIGEGGEIKQDLHKSFGKVPR